MSGGEVRQMQKRQLYPDVGIVFYETMDESVKPLGNKKSRRYIKAKNETGD